MNTIDESVWDTLRRDLLAVWEKMRQVLYPKYLLGGMMRGPESGAAAAESGEGDGLVGGGAAGALGNIRGLVGRWPDADAVLQGGMSEGLRDWDLWYAVWSYVQRVSLLTIRRGPLLFCLLLSFLLSLNAREDQRSLVFSGVFAMIWIAEAIVTLQIKLLGGNMYVLAFASTMTDNMLTQCQLLLPVGLHNRLHALPTRHRLATFSLARSNGRTDTGLHCSWALVVGSWRQHPWRQRSRQEPSRLGGLPALCILRWTGLFVLHFVTLFD